MTNLSKLIIQTRGDDIKCDVGGPSKEEGKYVGWITLYNDGRYHTELLSTNPVFDTKEDALKYMEDLVKKMREEPIEDPLGLTYDEPKQSVDVNYEI